jgi:hypothetical protein
LAILLNVWKVFYAINRFLVWYSLAKEFGVVPKTIYNLLGRQANKAGALIELAKVKRENEALLKIIGSLVADSRLGKKKK